MMFHTPKPRAEDIADAVRKRICLAPYDAQTVLLEGTLAAEFGISRTPVRQALQRLAYEGLIEVRTGVGSVVTPMDPADREIHLAVHAGLLALVAHLPDAPVPQDIARALGIVRAQERSGAPMDADATYATFTEMNALLSRMIPDPVIADAHLVSGWRIVRWFLSDIAEGRQEAAQVLQRLCEALRDNVDSGRVAMFRAASDSVLATGAPATKD